MIMATSMTRQHFKAIANAVAWYAKQRDGEVFDVELMASSLASELRPFNSNFDRAKFMEACKPENAK